MVHTRKDPGNVVDKGDGHCGKGTVGVSIKGEEEISKKIYGRSITPGGTYTTYFLIGL